MSQLMGVPVKAMRSRALQSLFFFSDMCYAHTYYHIGYGKKIFAPTFFGEFYL